MVAEVDRLRQKWAESDEHEIGQAIAALLDHRHGRRMLWWLLQIGKWGTQPYARDALDTAFSCGEMNVGQKVLDRILEVNPEGFVLLMKENADERSIRDTELANAYDADRDAGRDAPAELDD